MSGKNVSVLNIPPGVFRNASQYAAGMHWYDVNLVRWFNELLTPIGGWIKSYTFLSGTEIRNMFSWRDLLKAPWFAAGSSDRLWSGEVLGTANYTIRDITPAGLASNPGGVVGYGRAEYGSGAYGLDDAGSTVPDATALWSFDNFGKLLVATHSQDGRLFSYDPDLPSTVAAPVLNAPIDNTLVICTEEEYVMVMGGKNHPRRVKWCSQRDITDWTATEANTAGGFDLKSDGAIVTAVRVSGGILVLTDSDVHMVEYVGPPNYYGRRRVSEESSIVGKNCIVSTPRGAIWMGQSAFWQYDGAVSKLPCEVARDVFYTSDLTQSAIVHSGINEWAGEAWFFYPGRGSGVANRYAVFSYGITPYWTIGEMFRTAWMNPVWQTKPLGARGLDLYEQEQGFLDDTLPRIVYAETGGMEIEEGTNTMRIDRIYPDVLGIPADETALDALTMTFKLAQAPNAPERTVGPISLNNNRGYVFTRMRARQIIMRLDQIIDKGWIFGKTRIRVKGGGGR